MEANEVEVYSGPLASISTDCMEATLIGAPTVPTMHQT